MVKKLIINADDFGRSAAINDAIKKLVTAGRIASVSVLPNFPAFDDAVQFLSGFPNVSAGIHLNIVEGIPCGLNCSNELVDADGNFLSAGRIFKLWLLKRHLVETAIEREWRAQVTLLRETGLTISHADSHQHMHIFPPFWRIAHKVCDEFGIDALRSVRERLSTRRQTPSLVLRGFSNYSRANAIRTNDHFLGFARAGRYDRDSLIQDLSNLRDGVTELCMHPSLDDEQYQGFNGTAEFEALMDPGISEVLRSNGVESINWVNAA